MPNKFVDKEIRALCYKQRDTFDANGNPRTMCHHNHDNNDQENLIFVSADEYRQKISEGTKLVMKRWKERIASS